jgi:sterol desaturase/sphingolipid hydroxylase (fatty acid hydroxylase superfamily)
MPESSPIRDAGGIAFDLTVAAIPFYFGSMEAERRWLDARARTTGPTPSDYTKDDTVASLTMGVLSLVAPFAGDALRKRVRPGVLAGVAAGAAGATVVADRLAERGDRVGALARKVRRVSGPTAVAAGYTAVGSAVAQWGKASRQWRRNKGRDLGTGPLGWATAVVGWDFIYYWNHRLMHEVRAQWAVHVVHHSSERYNLSTALRQPVADVFGIFVPYGLLSRAGVRPRLVEHARGINLVYQYWIHTDAIRKLGRAEEVLNTPSHHRVHHGSNRQYIDRNHGSFLILWDRLFGTFEREDEPVVYGLTKNVGSYNPGRIASHEHVDILRDIARSTTWSDRLSFALRGPGWAYERHRRDGVVTAAAEAAPLT